MVSDFAGKLSPSVRNELETKLTEFGDRSGIELAVVALPFDELHSQPIEEYSLNLARQWGIGRGPDKLGLLLLVAIKSPGDAGGHYGGATRLEVSRKLERDITNDVAAGIIRKMRDDEKAGRFDQAVRNAVGEIIGILEQKRGIPPGIRQKVKR